MNSPLPSSLTYPHGFLDFLTLTPQRGHFIGDYELQESGLERFNEELQALSPESPALTLNQIATAAQRALDRYPDGSQPAFVSSRLASLERLEALVSDPGWTVDAEVTDKLEITRAYLDRDDGLIPNELPVVGRLDDALLIDVALQLIREELIEYEEFCRFRRVAADFARMPIEETGLTRDHWIEAMTQSHAEPARARHRGRYVPDARASLFHVT